MVRFHCEGETKRSPVVAFFPQDANAPSAAGEDDCAGSFMAASFPAYLTVKALLGSLIFGLVACSGLPSSAHPWNTDLGNALAQAKKENKMGFILLGREDCGNCQATKKLVSSGAVPVTVDKFVIADINTDDPVADAEFLQRFGRENFGDTLPFVVIIDSNGKVLAKYSGHKDEATLTRMVKAAMVTTGAAN
jgi:hypothetical protein